jgi:hypothetical protein
VFDVYISRVFLTSHVRNLRFSSISSDCLWTMPRTPIVLVIRGLTFQPTFLRVWIFFGGYLLDFFSYESIRKYVVNNR